MQRTFSYMVNQNYNKEGQNYSPDVYSNQCWLSKPFPEPNNQIKSAIQIKSIGLPRINEEKPIEENSTKIFVKGLSKHISAASLKEYFTQFGEVESIIQKFFNSKKKGKSSRGFAFIIYKEGKSVEKVLRQKEHYIINKKIVCQEAKPKSLIEEEINRNTDNKAENPIESNLNINRGSQNKDIKLENQYSFSFNKCTEEPKRIICKINSETRVSTLKSCFTNSAICGKKTPTVKEELLGCIKLTNTHARFNPY